MKPRQVKNHRHKVMHERVVERGDERWAIKDSNGRGCGMRWHVDKVQTRDYKSAMDDNGRWIELPFSTRVHYKLSTRYTRDGEPFGRGSEYRHEDLECVRDELDRKIERGRRNYTSRFKDARKQTLAGRKDRPQVRRKGDNG